MGISVSVCEEDGLGVCGINKLGFLTDRMRGSPFIVIFKCLEDK